MGWSGLGWGGGGSYICIVKFLLEGMKSNEYLLTGIPYLPKYDLLVICVKTFHHLGHPSQDLELPEERLSSCEWLLKHTFLWKSVLADTKTLAEGCLHSTAGL